MKVGCLRVCVCGDSYLARYLFDEWGARMPEAKCWYVICYDIIEPKRWPAVYKKLHGYGRRLQYSIFRCRLTMRQMERLHWELEAILTSEDRLLIVRVCESCERHVATHNRPEAWEVDAKSFVIA